MNQAILNSQNPKLSGNMSLGVDDRSIMSVVRNKGEFSGSLCNLGYGVVALLIHFQQFYFYIFGKPAKFVFDK